MARRAPAICATSCRRITEAVQVPRWCNAGAVPVLYGIVGVARCSLIKSERIARAKGRFYVLMRAEPGNAHYTERELYLGPALLDNPPPLWQDYLRWREGVVACEAGHERQLAWIREELAK